MDAYEAAAAVRKFWLDNSDRITSHDVLIAKCPFCGKTDRIRLFPKIQFEGQLADRDYEAAMEVLSKGGCVPAICGFCLNVVQMRGHEAEPPGED